MYPRRRRGHESAGKRFSIPFEYLMGRCREKAGLMNKDFKNQHRQNRLPCRRVTSECSALVSKRSDILELVPGTEIDAIERCSGHDGTYAVKKENYEFAQKICRPVVGRITKGEVAHYVSDCPMAGDLIEHGVGDASHATSAFTLLKQAYGI